MLSSGPIHGTAPWTPLRTRAPSTSDPGMNTCVIDMGSNSFKRIVGAFEGGRYVQHGMSKKTLGVGDDLARHGRISDAKLAEIEQALSEFKAACASDGTRRILAIGTAAFREAQNGGRVVEMAARLGIPMEIASEERESRLAYLVGALGRDGYAVIDNGSRSIELASKEAGREIRYSVFNLGYRVAFAEYFAGAEDARAAIAALRERLHRETENASFMTGHGRLVGVEFEEMAEVLFPPAATEGRFIRLSVLQQKVDEIADLEAEAFAALARTKHIDRALPRLVVAATLAERFGYDGIELTARELGTGLIIEAGLGTDA